MAKIDLEKFICSFMQLLDERRYGASISIQEVLQDQGLEYKDGDIVKTQHRVSDEAKEALYSESEDEKVRKWIYNYFRSCFPTWIHPDITCEEILAWLEKLKVFTEHGDGLYHFANSEFTYVGDPTWDNVSFLKNQCEHKPFDYENTTIMSKDFAPNVEQKPAWTEADDEEFEIAINTLKGAGQYDSAAWLITLKQRIGG